jgi:hypothetical protein
MDGMKRLYVFAVLFFSFAFASINPMRERLQGAKNGDYIVTEMNKMVSLLVVRSLSPQSLILEEISAPTSSLNPRPTSWSEWVKNRAPGHTSWSMMEFDLVNQQLTECYSFSRATWIQLTERENILSTLLKLPFTPVPLAHQRRIGPPPLSGETDHRKIWKPPFILERTLLQDHEFDVYSSVWPRDGTELGGTNIFLYFDHARLSPFPVWLQIETGHAGVPLQVIDAGKGLPEIYRTLPRRVPQFINVPQKTEHGLKLLLKSPKYYRGFDLFVVDVTERERQIYPITYSLAQGDGELLQLEITQDELHQTLLPNHRYTWLVVPTGHSEYYAESLKPFLWKGIE